MTNVLRGSYAAALSACSTFIALLVLALSGAPAIADPAGPPSSAATPAAPAAKGELEEITVTAEKRESTVQATAISMTALSTEDLKTENLATVEDIVNKVPGISIRTAGPGQTEYEMRGLSAAGGSAATVGFYLDETPLSANAVALNGRTVIDADLFDLNHVEVLRGPQGTLYGSGSMGGTIKLVTNQPKLGEYEAATDANVSDTQHGSVNGGGSLMLNLPLGAISAVRFVATEKYISGWIDRNVIPPPNFPAPTEPTGTPGAPANCAAYYCLRGNVLNQTVTQTIHGSNLERFASARASYLLKPTDALTITATGMYQVIRADGYNNYQLNPGGWAIYQPYDQQEPYRDYFRLASLKGEYAFSFATLTSATSYWNRDVFQSTDSTEALQNINNLTHLVNGQYIPDFIQNLYVETDPTWQFAEEIRLTSSSEGPLQWVGGLYYANLHSGYITYNQEPGFANAQTCGLPAASHPTAGFCAASFVGPANSPLRFPDPSLPPYPGPTAANPYSTAANPNGVVFNDNNPNVLKQYAIFGQGSYKITDAWKLTWGTRVYHWQNENYANQAGLGTASLNQDHTIQGQSANGNAVLPRLNLSYEPSSDLTLYGTIAKGSRPGGFNLPIPLPTPQVVAINPSAYNCAVGPVHVTSQPSYSADSVWSAELGEKWRFDERRFTLNADVYYIKWTDIQQVLSLTCGYPYNTNAGDAKSYGPEMEFSGIIMEGLTFDLSGTFTQAYVSSPNANAIASGINPGSRVLSVPKYTGAASLNYTTPFTDTLNGQFHLGSALIGPSDDQAAVRTELPSYNLVDARMGVSSGPWQAALFGTNLTNKQAAMTINNTVFAWQTYAITRVSTNQPRTIGLDFSYKW